MDRHKEDLFKSYRAAVAWGMYEEAARIHGQMIGLKPGQPDSSLMGELRAVEESPPSRGFFATLRALLSRPRTG